VEAGDQPGLNDECEQGKVCGGLGALRCQSAVTANAGGRGGRGRAGALIAQPINLMLGTEL